MLNSTAISAGSTGIMATRSKVFYLFRQDVQIITHVDSIQRIQDYKKKRLHEYLASKQRSKEPKLFSNKLEKSEPKKRRNWLTRRKRFDANNR
jgi:hypothetical protein